MRARRDVDAILIAIGMAIAVMLGAHVALVVFSFRGGTRRGMAALVLPPFAWVAAFLAPARRRQRVWASLALVLLFGSAAFAVDVTGGMHEFLSIAGTSVGEPHHAGRVP